MKKQFTPLIFILFFTSIINTQSASPKLSPLTRKYLKEIKAQIGEQQKLHDYVYKTGQNNKIFVSALIKVNNTINETDLQTLGIQIGTKAGNIWTAQIPIENVEPFTQINGIDYIELNEPAFPELYVARVTTRVDSVHAGYNLPMPYNGAGVVVGVVDAGFDFGHPVFFDTTGVGFRVKKTWLQKNNSGAPPAGYVYGTEETDSTALWTIGTDNGGTHATHVGGICAGSGYGSPLGFTAFRGVAYKSDLVFVCITPDKSQWVNTGVSDMIDGINYIFTYAASVSKPAVANLSWGSPLGPHDGTGLFSQALDNLTGPGKIFVCSAGNGGQDTIHLQKSFTANDTIVRTFLKIANSPEGKKTWVDIWGDSAKSFCVQVELYNHGQIASTGFVCLDDTIHDFNLLGLNNDTCLLSITTSSAEFNNRPRIFLDFNNRSAIDSVLISIKGTDGNVNMWNSFVSNTTGYYGKFTSYNYPWAVKGDAELTISDIASSKSAITVAAYASKTDYTDISGNPWTYSGYVTPGDIVPFSSHGPTLDGRIKPDITGPGLTVGSAISSYDTSFYNGASNYNQIVSSYHDPNNNRDYTFGELSGTSMSSPMVSGITAMLLQVKGDLSPQDVKDIYTQTAITDGFTGTIVPGGDVLWGHGKVNAYGAVKRAIQIVNSVKTISGSTLACNIFPNPNEGDFTLDFSGTKNENLTIEIFDAIGHCVFADKWKTNPGYNFIRIDSRQLAAGLYSTKVASEAGSSLIRMIIEK